MDEAWRILMDDGVMFINLMPHFAAGRQSDFVRRTIDGMCSRGWLERPKIAWIKVSGLSGNNDDYRMAHEDVYCFAKTKHPLADYRACGLPSDRIGFVGPDRFEGGVVNGYSDGTEYGVARMPNIIFAPVADVDRGIEHPAKCPPTLIYPLILGHSRPNDLVLDPFAGSGTTMRTALALERRFIGFEIEPEFADMANASLDSFDIIGYRERLHRRFFELQKKYRG